MSRTNEQPLKDVIEEFIKVFRLNNRLDSVRVKDLWEKIVGKLIAKHTKRLFIKNKTLFIELDSAALKQELSYAKNKIIKTINEKMDEKVVDEIIFI